MRWSTEFVHPACILVPLEVKQTCHNFRLEHLNVVGFAQNLHYGVIFFGYIRKEAHSVFYLISLFEWLFILVIGMIFLQHVTHEVVVYMTKIENRAVIGYLKLCIISVYLGPFIVVELVAEYITFQKVVHADFELENVCEVVFE